ncbi:hypothetical protein PLO_1882 [Pediococcus acidilactici NGRI 0510Q]|nr:hypothetical protein PLO_1882 [Pediococcus acidilactici NGRI 0510Q]
MNQPDLKDPRTLYHTDKFPAQQQDTPAIQEDDPRTRLW